MTIEHFDWLRVSLHAPVKDGRVRNQSHGVNGDPFPEKDVLRHAVRFHFALHLDIEDLQRPSRCGQMIDIWHVDVLKRVVRDICVFVYLHLSAR